ncbi:hypothetical protein [Pseudoxanthomonas sacheonensis]|uniref:hypothetical protein n=1 Tax=Pseudoxanthomonas sacheonensis TaxID=443615 RepID=UPI0013D8AF9B|nr:hypothetical protein [Pseudoxanthomonas sacheonensis]KAF1709079.1 hypothetical protein CSC73_07490 [Pseudoxanthomonas sacheonensis]
MSEQNTFFRWVYRLLAIGGLCLLLAIAYVWIAGSISSRQWRGRNTVEVEQAGRNGRKQVQTLRFDGLESIKGSAVQLIKVESEDEGGNKVGFSSGGYGAAFTTRNVIFLEAGNGVARWLFPDNDQFIGKVSKLCVCEDGKESDVLAIYLEVARGKAGETGAASRVVPALVRTDGNGYTELGKPVSRVLDNVVSDDGKTLGLLVEDKGKLLYRQFSLESFAQLSERLVTQLDRK